MSIEMLCTTQSTLGLNVWEHLHWWVRYCLYTRAHLEAYVCEYLDVSLTLTHCMHMRYNVATCSIFCETW